MTYFHRRTSTIIGAKAFHFPVRDGKEWDHLAMVVKRNRLFWRFSGRQNESAKKHRAWFLTARGVIMGYVFRGVRAARICALDSSQRDFIYFV